MHILLDFNSNNFVSAYSTGLMARFLQMHILRGLQGWRDLALLALAVWPDAAGILDGQKYRKVVGGGANVSRRMAEVGEMAGSKDIYNGIT